MNDFYTPPDTPDDISIFDSEIRQLAAGQAGKNGRLVLVFEDDATGRTVLGKQFCMVPFHVQRALYCDPLCPGMAHVYVVSASGGILQGDRYRTDITMRRNSRAHITTQGATRIYGMDAASATQILNITLEEGSYLEYIPDQIIPYQHSRFYQRSNLTIHDSATLVYSEIISPGRVAMGESHKYDIFHIKTKAYDQNGRLVLVDTARMDAKRHRPKSFGILGDHTILGTIYIITAKKHAISLYKKITTLIHARDDMSGGASIIKDDRGVLVRILGDDTKDMMDITLDVVAHVRKACTGFSFSGIRKN